MNSKDRGSIDRSIEDAFWLCPLDNLKVNVLYVERHLSMHGYEEQDSEFASEDWFHEEGKPIDWRVP